MLNFEVWVGPLLQPVKVPIDAILSLSTLTGNIICKPDDSTPSPLPAHLYLSPEGQKYYTADNT